MKIMRVGTRKRKLIYRYKTSHWVFLSVTNVVRGCDRPRSCKKSLLVLVLESGKITGKSSATIGFPPNLPARFSRGGGRGSEKRDVRRENAVHIAVLLTTERIVKGVRGCEKPGSGHTTVNGTREDRQ